MSFGSAISVERGDVMTVEKEIALPGATIQLTRFHLDSPVDNVLCVPGSFWLDLSITPRLRTRVCYPDYWPRHCFERLGSVFVLPPDTRMHARSEEGVHHTSLLCHMDAEYVREWSAGNVTWTPERLRASACVSSPVILSLLQRIAGELEHPGFATETLVELITGQLAIELGRYLFTINAPSGGGLAPWRLRLI